MPGLMMPMDIDTDKRTSTTTTLRLDRMAYSPAEAAEVLGLCRASIYNLMARGELRSASLGRARRIPRVELERLLAGEAI